VTLPAPKIDWKLKDISGTTARDSVGGAALEFDRESFVPGRSGKALRFNPKDGARLVTTTFPEMPPPWTAALWVKREEDSESATLFSSTKFAFKLEQWPHTHALGFTLLGHSDESFGITARVNEWVHVALVGTAAQTTLYVNGERKGTLATAVNLKMQWLGSTLGRSDFASMLLDEIKIFDRALTSDQVREVMGPTPQRVDEPNPALESRIVESIAGLRAELLSEIETVVARAVERSLARLLPDLMRAWRPAEPSYEDQERDPYRERERDPYRKRERDPYRNQERDPYRNQERDPYQDEDPDQDPDEDPDQDQEDDSFTPASVPMRPIVVIAHINSRGVEDHEADEYVEIANRGTLRADLSGYQIRAVSSGHLFVFPEGATLEPAETARIYTDIEEVPGTEGFSFDSDEPIWNNSAPDAAELLDSDGRLIAEYRLRGRGAAR
jgi:hypothetical protein